MADSGWTVLRDALRHRANSDPERVAFTHGEEEITFADLLERASGRARAFQREGVGAGDRVALALSPGLPFVEVFWALQLLGAVPCAFNPFVPAPTLARRVERVRPRLVVSDETAASLASAPGPVTETEIGGEDLAFLQLTSGTSGAPRASMLRHRNVCADQRSQEGIVRPDEVVVSWVPAWHDLGLVRFIIGPVHHGISCHIVEPAVRTIPQWLRTISQVRATWSAAPDFAFRLAVRMVDPATVDLSSLRMITSGGEPVRGSSIEAFESRFGVPGVIQPGYGLGEATLAVTTHRPGDTIRVDKHGNVSCGRPVPGLDVQSGRSVEEPEEIRVRGDAVFAGYFDAPEDTRRALRDGWLHTGDTGYQDEEGRLFVLGRREGMIKRAGGLIAPRELEEAAQRAAGVRMAAAVSLPAADADADADDVIVVAVETDGSEHPAEQIAADVSGHVVAALGFSPGYVSVLPPHSIPRTENGKVRHAKLRALVEDSRG